MSAPDSRKAFLSKLCLCLAAAGTLPGLLRRRLAAPAATPRDSGLGFSVKADQRAIAREPTSL